VRSNRKRVILLYVLLQQAIHVYERQLGRFTGVTEPTSLGGEMLVDWIRAYCNGSVNSTIQVAECEECPVESSAMKSRSNSFAVLVTMASVFLAAVFSV
jgi:hypothetical protein